QTVTLGPSSGLQVDFNQGGSHSASTWNTGLASLIRFTGGSINHQFNNAQTFSGSGTIAFLGGNIIDNPNMTVLPLTNHAVLNYFRDSAGNGDRELRSVSRSSDVRPARRRCARGYLHFQDRSGVCSSRFERELFRQSRQSRPVGIEQRDCQ